MWTLVSGHYAARMFHTKQANIKLKCETTIENGNKEIRRFSNNSRRLQLF